MRASKWILIVTATSFLLGGAWWYYRTQESKRFAEAFIDTLFLTPLSSDQEARWKDAVANLAQRDGIGSTQVEAKLKRYATGGFIPRANKGREGVVSNLIEKHWQGALRIAREEAKDHRSFGSLALLGEVATFVEDVETATPALEDALKDKEGSSEARIRLQVQLAQIRIATGKLDEASSLADLAIQTMTDAGKPQDLTTADLLALKALIITQRGDATKAEEAFRELLALLEKLEPEGQRMAGCLTPLGRTLLARDNVQEAEVFLKRANDIQVKLAMDAPSTGLNLAGLAEVFRRKGEFAKASEYFDRAAKKLDALNQNSPAMITILCARGRNYLSMERPNDAFPLLDRALKSIEKVGGEALNSPLLADILDAWGEAACKLGNMTEAEKAVLRAYEILQAKGLVDQPAGCRTVAHVGEFYLMTNRPHLAESYIRRAQSIAKAQPDVLEKEFIAHLDLEMAKCLSQQGLFEEAEQLLQSCLASSRDQFGEDSPQYLAVEFDLARLYLAADRLPEAEAGLLKVIAKEEKIFGKEDKQLVTSLNCLGVILRQQGRSTEAIRHLKRALEIQSKSNPKDVEPRIVVAANLSSALIDGGAPAEAIPILEKIAAVQEKKSATEPIGISATLNYLSKAYDRTGNAPQAELCIRKSYRILRDHRKTTGESLPEEEVILDQLRAFYKRRGLSEVDIDGKIEDTLSSPVQ